MTNSETREQKVRLTLELEDAESNLEASRRIAQTHGELLISVGEMLRNRPEAFYRNGYSAHYGHRAEDLNFIDDRTVAAFDIRRAISETNAVRENTEKVRKLQELLSRFG
jgi:hypothetical protein